MAHSWRVGGPAVPVPQPGPGPGASQTPTPSQTPVPNPQPGPAPNRPPSQPAGFDPFGLTSYVQRALGQFQAAGEVGLGLALAGAGLLILLSQTRAGGELASAGKAVAKTTAKVAVAVAK